MLDIRTGIRIVNWEDPDQTASSEETASSSEVVLSESALFALWQATSVQILEHPLYISCIHLPETVTVTLCHSPSDTL